jgi:hypothetical protein
VELGRHYIEAPRRERLLRRRELSNELSGLWRYECHARSSSSAALHPISRTAAFTSLCTVSGTRTELVAVRYTSCVAM